jgi:hypothetical protein
MAIAKMTSVITFAIVMKATMENGVTWKLTSVKAIPVSMEGPVKTF